MRPAIALALLLVPAASGAGELSTLHGLAVRDASHRVTVTLDGRVARFRIAHRLVSGDRRGDEAFLEVDLPGEGAAVGLRARAPGRWVGGRLLDAEKADARYEELTQSGRPGAGLGAAILGWDEVERASLAVFPVTRRQPAEVEIEALAPLCYAEGLAVAFYPLPQGGQVAPPVVEVTGSRRHWIVRPDRDLPAAIAARWTDVKDRCEADDSHLAIAWDTEPEAPLAAAAASLDLASGRRLVWVEIDSARQLAPPPRGAHILFLLDASRSLGAAGLAAELALVRGYLASAPDADVELVVYRRRATRLFGRFQPARRVNGLLAALPAGALALENGSHLDAGLALAGTLARGLRGPVRLVAFNDDLVRAALDARAMAGALGSLPAGSIAHLVELSGGAGDFLWIRGDDHPFAAAVMATGGMLVTMFGDDRVTARAAMRGLVQPLRVDGLRIEGAELGDFSSELDEQGALPAGRGIRLSALLAAGQASGPLTVRGRIWGRELALPIAADRGLEAALPAFAFGGERREDLDDAEKVEVARRGGVVSPATSLLVELDDRPTGHDEMLGASGCGCGGGMTLRGGSSHGGSIDSVGRVQRGPEPDRAALLAGALAAPLRACAALHGAARIDLTIETTVDEVVDVAVSAGGHAALADCAREAAWALALDARFDQPHATFRLPFDPG